MLLLLLLLLELCHIMLLFVTCVMHLYPFCNRRTINVLDDDDDDTAKYLRLTPEAYLRLVGFGYSRKLYALTQNVGFK